MEKETQEKLKEQENYKAEQGRNLNGDDYFNIAYELGEDHPDFDELLRLCRQDDLESLREAEQMLKTQ